MAPGGYDRLLEWKIRSEILGNLDILAALIAIGVKGYRNWDTQVYQSMRH